MLHRSAASKSNPHTSVKIEQTAWTELGTKRLVTVLCNLHCRHVCCLSVRAGRRGRRESTASAIYVATGPSLTAALFPVSDLNQNDFNLSKSCFKQVQASSVTPQNEGRTCCPPLTLNVFTLKELVGHPIINHQSRHKTKRHVKTAPSLHSVCLGLQIPAQNPIFPKGGILCFCVCSCADH